MGEAKKFIFRFENPKKILAQQRSPRKAGFLNLVVSRNRTCTPAHTYTYSYTCIINGTLLHIFAHTLSFSYFHTYTFSQGYTKVHTYSPEQKYSDIV